MPAPADLKQLLTRLKLRRLAGSKTFEHGADYFAAGHVTSLFERAGKLAATVQGTHEYHVLLFAEGDTLAFNCTCPMGEEGAVCKHCVAAGLAWLAHSTVTTRTKKNGAATPAMTLDDARAWLSTQDKSELIEIILDRAATDPRLREHLLRQVAMYRTP